MTRYLFLYIPEPKSGEVHETSTLQMGVGVGSGTLTEIVVRRTSPLRTGF